MAGIDGMVNSFEGRMALSVSRRLIGDCVPILFSRLCHLLFLNIARCEILLTMNHHENFYYILRYFIDKPVGINK